MTAYTDMSWEELVEKAKELTDRIKLLEAAICGGIVKYYYGKRSNKCPY